MPRRKAGVMGVVVAVLGLGALEGHAWAQDFQIQTCEVNVVGGFAQFHVVACRNRDIPLELLVYYNRDDPPPTSNPTGDEPPVPWPTGGPSCKTFYVPASIPAYPQNLFRNGTYHGYCQLVQTSNGQQVAVKDTLWRVGPDLVVPACSFSKDGATIKYRALVCNIGTDVARNFRVGFYYNLQHPPGSGEYSNHFKALSELRFSWYWWGWQPTCKEIKWERHNTPNGFYTSWVKADSGEFELEGREDNNVCGPMYIDMANPDLVIRQFDAKVSEQRPYVVTYYVKVCNEGAATAKVFWVDIYYDRGMDEAPQLGEPGDVHRRVENLRPGDCLEDHFDWLVTETSQDGTALEFRSWVQADADEFTSDPDRSTNLVGPLKIRVPGGVLPSGCLDQDGDGYGVGAECEGPQDCDDDNPAIHPQAEEVCGNGVDDNCNDNIDDGCPGVDCVDGDGDGAPYGTDCQRPDCDDQDPRRSPLFQEVCGDGIDNDCDGIVDDCCPGVDCCDADNDGYGVGDGCEGPQDCDDSNPRAAEGGEEVCGDGIDNDCDGIVDDCCEGTLCCDADNDGYGVGVGCGEPQDPDDGNPDVHPGSEEICGNGLDDDGDGVADEGCNTCVDNDGDGYCVGDGDCSAVHPECVGRPKDCDDVHEAVHPGASEQCNGVDDDCNLTVDDSSDPNNLCPDPNCVMACAEADCVRGCATQDWACLYQCGRQNETCASRCATVDCVDRDGDGWGSGPDCTWEDYRDDDSDKHPMAGETCNLEDDNCNGSVDETIGNGTPCPDPDCVRACGGDAACRASCPPVDCADRDGDGWPTGPDCAGEQDPDDSDPSVHPHAREVCGDGVDQDGDGVADEGCLLCVDLDRDGYGIGSHCVARDCNDLDPEIHPGAQERCGQGDRNCDGKTMASDKCPPSCATAGTPLWPWLLLLPVLLRKRKTHTRRGQ